MILFPSLKKNLPLPRAKTWRKVSLFRSEWAFNCASYLSLLSQFFILSNLEIRKFFLDLIRRIVWVWDLLNGLFSTKSVEIQFSCFLILLQKSKLRLTDISNFHFFHLSTSGSIKVHEQIFSLRLLSQKSIPRCFFIQNQKLLFALNMLN